jgi:hypothetical protein
VKKCLRTNVIRQISRDLKYSTGYKISDPALDVDEPPVEQVRAAIGQLRGVGGEQGDGLHRRRVETLKEVGGRERETHRDGSSPGGVEDGTDLGGGAREQHRGGHLAAAENAVSRIGLALER